MTAAAIPASHSRRAGPLARLMRQPLAAVGLAIVAAFLAVAMLAPILPLADPNLSEPARRLIPPLTDGHLLGTDQLGRDVLSRVIWGLRVSLAVGALATLAAAAVGSAIGLLAAFYGRFVDGALMRLIDVLMAFPYLLLALGVVATLGPGLMNAAIAIAIANVPFFARAVRGSALVVVGRDYVEAARMAGLSHFRILMTEVLPNVLPLIVVTAATTIGWMILETAGLSFLGLGAQPPQADLGSMLGDGRKTLSVAPHVAAVPGVVTFVLVVGLNLLGDGLRDLLDPRMADGRGGAPAAATKVERDVDHQPPHNGEGGGAGDASSEFITTPSDLKGRRPDPHPRPLPSWERGEGAPLLSVEALTTAFDLAAGRHAAIRDVSFTLDRGGSLGIVGESGSGKSVTALSLARLAASPPGAIVGGRVMLDGEDVLDQPFEALRELRGARIAYVFQDPSTTLNPVMPVGRQITEAVAAHGGVSPREAERRAKELIAEVELPDADRMFAAYPHELSGGQRQRIGVAMALAAEPDVLIADEPTTALDATTQATALRLFDRLRSEHGATLIFVSHDFSVIGTLCDRVAVMYAGEIVEEGRTQEVLGGPRHPYTARLIACAPKLREPDRALEAIEGGPPPIDGRPRGCSFAPRCRIAIPECEAGPIELVDLGGGRKARCIRADEVANGRF